MTVKSPNLNYNRAMFNQDAINYVNQQRAAGVADDAIRSALEQSGWDAQGVLEAMNPVVATGAVGGVTASVGASILVKVAAVFSIALVGAGGYYLYSTNTVLNKSERSVMNVVKPTPNNPTPSKSNSIISDIPATSSVVQEYKTLAEKFERAEFKIAFPQERTFYQKGLRFAKKSPELQEIGALGDEYVDRGTLTQTVCSPRQKGCSVTSLSKNDAGYSSIMGRYSGRQIFEKISGFIYYALSPAEQASGGIQKLSIDQLYEYLDRYNREGTVTLSKLPSKNILGYSTICFEQAKTGVDAFRDLYCLESRTGVPLYRELTSFYSNGEVSNRSVKQASEFLTEVKDSDVSPPLGYIMQ